MALRAKRKLEPTGQEYGAGGGGSWAVGGNHRCGFIGPAGIWGQRMPIDAGAIKSTIPPPGLYVGGSHTILLSPTNIQTGGGGVSS